MRKALWLLGFAGVAMGLSTVGCAVVGEDSGADEGALTPETPSTMFEQVKICDGHVRFKIGVRKADLASGLVRWKCGDVDGVDLSDGINDFGQEYCEYHALADGKNVDESDAPTGDVKCVYTSAFTDSTIDTDKVGKALQTQMSLASVPDRNAIRMQNSVNSRHAARVLIDDCAEIGAEPMTNAERQTACFTAQKTASAALKAKLRAACVDIDLADDAKWKVVQDLGVKSLDEMPEGDEREVLKDIAACAQSYKVVETKPGAVVLWRNSDPTICGRILRAANECGDTFNSLDDVTSLQGFDLTSWNDDHDPATPPQVPAAGCKFADVDGKPFQQSLVCTPSEQAVAQAKLDHKPMQLLCNELFGAEIAMAAPVGAVSVTGTKKETTFCKAFHEGARASGGGKPAAPNSGSSNGAGE